MGSSQSTRKITLVNDDKAGVIKLSESLAYRLRGQIEGQQAAASVPAAAPEPAPVPTPATVTPPPAPPPPVAAAPAFPQPPSFPFIVPRESPGKAGESTLETPSAPEASVGGAAPELPVILTLPDDTTATATATPAQAPDIDTAIKAGPGPTLIQPGGNIPPWSIYAEEAHLMVMRLKEEKEQEVKKLNEDWREKMDIREKEFTKIARLSEEEVTEAVKEVERLFVRASCSPVCQNQQESVMQCYQDHPHQSLRCAREVDYFAQCVDLARLQSVMKERVD